LLYDKIYREDILLHAYRLAKAKGGGAGVDGITFKMIEKEGVNQSRITLGHMGVKRDNPDEFAIAVDPLEEAVKPGRCLMIFFRINDSCVMEVNDEGAVRHLLQRWWLNGVHIDKRQIGIRVCLDCQLSVGLR
jgi:hypothetical protein